jgi:hypothetical protein
VALTAEGRALAKRLVPVVEEVDAAFFGRLGPAQSRALTGLLAKVVAGA